ncbi:MAG TPA: hypothetical protein VEO53_00210, partial [Candidatus Binatia bacterium]|nr:hypothetical protein [Candidatus Binatia bacterium]
MAEAYNFTATGTHSTQAGFPGAGFSTKATELTYGVNVQGLKCGVYGECLPYGPNIRTTRLHGAGVAGASRECGVYGECLPPASKITLKELYGAGVAGAGEETGVAGKGEVGVVGHGKGVGVAGHGVVFGGLFDGGITGCVAG